MGLMGTALSIPTLNPGMSTLSAAAAGAPRREPAVGRWHGVNVKRPGGGKSAQGTTSSYCLAVAGLMSAAPFRPSCFQA